MRVSRDDHGDRTLTLMFIPAGGRRSRTLRVSYARLRWLVPLAGLLALGCAFLVGSWGYLAVGASRARELEQEVARLLEREAQVEELAQTLTEVEAAYDNLRSLFGADAPDGVELWLPPTTGRPRARASADPGEAGLPTDWPLTERGFVTQALLAEEGAEHPGIDIAIPSGSYVRAAGSGTVAETGEDRTYGNFVVIDHGVGYRTLYAHASLILTAEGQPVRKDEVIALSGSSGRSTAPHLHFEIQHEGEPIDPLTLVTQP